MTYDFAWPDKVLYARPVMESGCVAQRAMEEEKEPQRFKPWKELANYGALSLNLAMLMLGGYFLGQSLDKHYHTGPRWMLIGTFVGMVLGLYTIVEISIRLSKTGRKNGRK